MLNPLNFISKFIKSGNKKELDRISKIVKQINLLEENVKKLKDDKQPAAAIYFKHVLKLHSFSIDFFSNRIETKLKPIDT